MGLLWCGFGVVLGWCAGFGVVSGVALVWLWCGLCSFGVGVLFRHFRFLRNHVELLCWSSICRAPLLELQLSGFFVGAPFVELLCSRSICRAPPCRASLLELHLSSSIVRAEIVSSVVPLPLLQLHCRAELLSPKIAQKSTEYHPKVTQRHVWHHWENFLN